MRNENIYSSSLFKKCKEIFINDWSFDCNPSVDVNINVAIAYLNLSVDSEDMCVKCF